jgi:hypothetical protein
MTEAGEPASPAPPAKPIKTWQLRIEALKFKTDHALLVDNTADWTKSGAAIPKPEWTRNPVANGPITHTRNETIEADATFLCPQADADTKSATLEGAASIDALSLQSSGATSFGPHDKKTVAVKGKAPLPDFVGPMNLPITWTAKAGEDYAAGASGPHRIYVTYAKPIVGGLVEDGVTIKRMEKTLDWVSPAWSRGKHEPVDLIEAMFKHFNGYILSLDMLSASQLAHLAANPSEAAALTGAGFAAFHNDGKGGAWPLAEFVKYGGECQAIVRLCQAMAHQVGLPGLFEQKFLSSQPADPYKVRILDTPNIGPDGPIPGFRYALVDGEVKVGSEYGAKSGVGFNRFEAFLKYTNGPVTWFGGGIGRMPAGITDQAMLKVFWGLAAFSAGAADPDSPGFVKYKIEHVWKY